MPKARKSARKKRDYVTRKQVLDAMRKDPTGNLLADILIAAGVGARVEPSRDYERYIPLPQLHIPYP